LASYFWGFVRTARSGEAEVNFDFLIIKIRNGEKSLPCQSLMDKQARMVRVDTLRKVVIIGLGGKIGNSLLTI